MTFDRRQLLISTAIVVGSGLSGKAGAVSRSLPWRPGAGAPPEPAKAGGWIFFTPEEGLTVEAIADRIIPPDETTPKVGGVFAF